MLTFTHIYRPIVVMLIMPLMGFSCWRIDSYLVRPDVDTSNFIASSNIELKEYEKVLEVFRKWAASEQLTPTKCDVNLGVADHQPPCEAYIAKYEECGLLACSPENLRIALLVDSQHSKILIEFFDFGRWSKSTKEKELQDNLKATIENSFGKDSMVDFQEPNKSSEPTR